MVYTACKLLKDRNCYIVVSDQPPRMATIRKVILAHRKIEYIDASLYAYK